jgi:iron-sulfur cluster insertion protein
VTLVPNVVEIIIANGPNNGKHWRFAFIAVAFAVSILSVCFILVYPLIIVIGRLSRMSVDDMQEPVMYTPQVLVFTEAAAQKVAVLINEEENPALKLRAFITGGGCSGFQYGFTFDELVQEDDTVIEQTVALVDAKPQTVLLLVDPMSFQYLAGATIDYKEDLDGARFVIINPNAKTTCGCGSSFSPE